MTRYALNLPASLKQEAEEWASQQGISLNQFIMWSVAEKVAALRSKMDDPNYPGITYRRGASGIPQPVLRGSGLRVQTLAWEASQGAAPEEIAREYDLEVGQVRESLAFYETHRVEMETHRQAERMLEPKDD